MANDKDIKIGLQTVGADTAASEIDKVPDALKKIPDAATEVEQSNVRITDSAKKNTTALAENVEGFKKWQQERQKANREAGSASTAIAESYMQQEKAAREAAAAASNLAAQEEAAAVRRGKAQKKLTDELLEEAKRRKKAEGDLNNKGLLGRDVTGGAEKAIEKAASAAGLEKQFSVLKTVVSADAAAMVGSVAAIGAAAVKAYDLLDDTAVRWREFQKEAKAGGVEFTQEMKNELAALEATLKPIKTVVGGVKTAINDMWKMVKDPVGELSGLNDLKDALARAKEQADKLKDARLKIATERQGEIVAVYNRELAALNEQEQTLRRISGLRNELNSIEMQRANNQVDIARQTGGDVELAQANALAVELKVGLAKLGGNLSASQQSAKTAEKEFNLASIAYQAAFRDGLDKLDPEKFAGLSAAFDQKQQALADANQAVEDQKQVFDAQAPLLLENMESKLRELDTNAKGKINDEADKVRTSIYDAIKEKFSSLGGATGEVSEALETERAGTVEKVKALAPTPADTAKVTGAVQEVKGGLDEQGNAFIAALAGVTAVANALTARVKAQEAQIQQLHARLR